MLPPLLVSRRPAAPGGQRLVRGYFFLSAWISTIWTIIKGLEVRGNGNLAAQ
jgi:hypothetical protein